MVSSSRLHSSVAYVFVLSCLTYFTYNRKNSSDDGASLDNLLSPQYKAYNWLVTSGNGTFLGSSVTSDIHFLQRYGLAVLFFRQVFKHALYSSVVSS